MLCCCLELLQYLQFSITTILISKRSDLNVCACSTSSSTTQLVNNFQLLKLSRNLLKSQISIMVCVERGGGGAGDQFPTYNAESKSAKMPKSHYGGGGGGLVTNFQLLMPSPNLLRFQSLIMVGMGGC